MTNFLEQIFSILPVTHRESIQQILEELRTNSIAETNREIQFEAQRLTSLIKDKEQIFAPILAIPQQRISSDDHNQNMESVFIDLQGLYKQTAHTGNIQKQQVASIQSDFNKARAAILKLINDARLFAIRSRSPEYDDVKLVNFNIARNSSRVRPIAQIDPESRLLKLPEILKVRNHLERRNSKLTNATVELLLSGQKGHLGTESGPSRATDSKTETFWAEVVFADVPIKQLYTRHGTTGGAPIVETVNGPIAKYNLEFSASEPINQVKILPFAPHPIKVLEITYRPTKSSEVRIPIKDFIVEESLDWIEYNFETVFASDIEIVFVQENYREFVIHIPKHVLYATDFLLRLVKKREDQLEQIPNLKDINLGGNHELYMEAINDLSNLLTSKNLEKSPSTEIDLAGKTILSIGETMVNFSPELKSLLEEVTSYTEQVPNETSNEIETLKKSEYIIGAREIQTNYVLYSPVGNYESEKFEPKTTISHVELEVDERHPSMPTKFGPQKNTSTEWEIEFSEDRRVPIYPTNHVVNGFLPVNGERLDVDFASRVGLSRFASQINFVVVRENNKLLTQSVHYTVVWSTDFQGRLQIAIHEDEFDQNKVYTIDYFAAQAAKQIDVLTRYDSKKLPLPDSFEKTDKDDKVRTKYAPYVNYGIVNSDDFMLQADVNSYRYSPPTGAYTTGLVEIYPNWTDDSFSYLPISGHITVSATGATGSNGDATVVADFGELNSTYLSDPYRYYLKINDLPGEIHELISIVDENRIEIKNTPVFPTGFIGNELDTSWVVGNILDYTGAGDTQLLTGYLRVPYSIHVVYKDGDSIYGFDNLNYDPVSVSVGGDRAKNITNYTDLEQPAFTVTDALDHEYEFIHDGKNIYFNQSISNTEIQVDYKWMTKYVKVNCTLRANKVVNPTVTPQVNEYKLLLNTTIL